TGRPMPSRSGATPAQATIALSRFSSLVCSASAQPARRCVTTCTSGQGDVDEFLERGALAEAREPGLDVRQPRPLDRAAHPALHLGADRDVAHGEVLAADVGLLLEAPLEDLGRELVARHAAFLDRFRVALL